MIKFGLLGCGRIAKRHADLLGGHHVDRASLAGVCDPIRARADAIASLLMHLKVIPDTPGLRPFHGLKGVIVAGFVIVFVKRPKTRSRASPSAQVRVRCPSRSTKLAKSSLPSTSNPSGRIC